MKTTEGIVSHKVSGKGTHVVITTMSGRTVTIPKAQWVEGSETITVIEHKKGDTFVAARDSSRTKGAVLGEKCPKGKEDEALYFLGEAVTRLEDSFQFEAFGTFDALIKSLEAQSKMLEVQAKMQALQAK